MIIYNYATHYAVHYAVRYAVYAVRFAQRAAVARAAVVRAAVARPVESVFAAASGGSATCGSVFAHLQQRARATAACARVERVQQASGR